MALAPRWEIKGRVKSRCLLKVSCECTETFKFYSILQEIIQQ